MNGSDLNVYLVKEGVVINKNNTSHEKFIHGIKTLMAKNYLDNLREEVNKGMDEKVESTTLTTKSDLSRGEVAFGSPKGNRTPIPTLKAWCPNH